MHVLMLIGNRVAEPHSGRPAPRCAASARVGAASERSHRPRASVSHDHGRAPPPDPSAKQSGRPLPGGARLCQFLARRSVRAKAGPEVAHSALASLEEALEQTLRHCSRLTTGKRGLALPPRAPIGAASRSSECSERSPGELRILFVVNFFQLVKLAQSIRTAEFLARAGSGFFSRCEPLATGVSRTPRGSAPGPRNRNFLGHEEADRLASALV